MRFPSWLLLLIVIAAGGLVLAWLLPLAARWPLMVSPEAYARANPQRFYRSPGIMGITPVFVGVITVGVFTTLYFWLAEKLARYLT